jgi:hypothetical protein
VTIVAELPPGVIPVSADEFDRLYPRYELEAKAGETFQQWLKADRRRETAKKVKLVTINAGSASGLTTDR